MYFHLQKCSINTWKHLFGKNNEKWQHVLSDDDENEDEMPAWFQWVAQWFFNGLNGPFGRVNYIPDDMIRSFYPTDFSKILRNLGGIPKNLVPYPSCTAFIQRESHNCGICCLLFMIDFLLSQVDQTWQLPVAKKGILQQNNKLGTDFVNQNILKAQQMSLQGYLDILFLVFRRKFVIFMEELGLMYLASLVL